MPVLARARRSTLGRFFGGSLVGLAIDVGGFQLLVAEGLDGGVANVLSSSCSVVAVYLLVSRHAFGARRSVGTLVAFCGWYAANIAATSLAVHLAAAWWWDVPILWKLCSIPVSFTANYLFGRVLFRRARVEPGDGAAGQATSSNRPIPVPRSVG